MCWIEWYHPRSHSSIGCLSIVKKGPIFEIPPRLVFISNHAPTNTVSPTSSCQRRSNTVDLILGFGQNLSQNWECNGNVHFLAVIDWFTVTLLWPRIIYSIQIESGDPFYLKSGQVETGSVLEFCYVGQLVIAPLAWIRLIKFTKSPNIPFQYLRLEWLLHWHSQLEIQMQMYFLPYVKKNCISGKLPMLKYLISRAK